MKYARWVEVVGDILDDPAAFRGVVARLVDDLRLAAEREGYAVDLGTLSTRTTASRWGPARGAVIAEARVGYQFTPIAAQLAGAVRWRQPRWLRRFIQ